MRQTVPRRTPLGSVQIAERFFIFVRDVFARVDFGFFSFRVACRSEVGGWVFSLGYFA